MAKKRKTRERGPLAVEFGDSVRAHRQAASLTQEKLAEASGLHVTYIGGIERGERNPSLLNIGKIADALDVTLEELFSGQ